MRTTSRALAASTVAALALAAPALAAGTAPKAPVATHSLLRITTEPSALGFLQGKLSATPGKTTVLFVNRSKTTRDLAIERAGAKKPLATRAVKPGKSVRLRISLRKGTYDYFFTGIGHAKGAMRGVLTVA